MRVTAQELKEILTPMKELGGKFGALLVQLPPTLAFQPNIAEEFFSNIRFLCGVPVYASLATIHGFAQNQLGSFIITILVKCTLILSPAPISIKFKNVGEIKYD